jgi:hypothetical protein
MEKIGRVVLFWKIIIWSQGCIYRRLSSSTYLKEISTEIDINTLDFISKLVVGEVSITFSYIVHFRNKVWCIKKDIKDHDPRGVYIRDSSYYSNSLGLLHLSK